METQLQQRIRERLGLRVGPETAAYLARRVEASALPVVVMGGDARTGRPVLREVDVDLAKAVAEAPAP